MLDLLHQYLCEQHDSVLFVIVTTEMRVHQLEDYLRSQVEKSPSFELTYEVNLQSNNVLVEQLL